MSLGHFLKHIWDAIKKLFEGLPDEFKQAIHIGVVITESIKNFDAANPELADILTAIIPGDLDDVIKTKLRSALPKILIQLKLAETCVAVTNPSEIVACAIKVLQGIEGDFKSAFLHDLSILIAQVAADGRLSWEDGVLLLEYYYQHKYKSEVI